MSPRTKLANMLMDLGFAVNEDDLQPLRERKSKFNDVYAWSGIIYKDGKPIEIYSWDTMTLCAKRGITIDSDVSKDKDGYGLEVYASS